jgi:hypothetical protein
MVCQVVRAKGVPAEGVPNPAVGGMFQPDQTSKTRGPLEHWSPYFNSTRENSFASCEGVAHCTILPKDREEQDTHSGWRSEPGNDQSEPTTEA